MTDETIFTTALEQPSGAARALYLRSACADDAQRTRIEALLAAVDKAGSFLERPAGGAPADPDHAPTVALGSGPSAADDEGADALKFLAPAGRADSLGRIGHYEVLQVLGRGAFGVVYRAFDDVLQRVVAVKVLSPQMAATSPARKRFLREARTSAAVRHENVVQVYEVGEQPLPYLVMEFIPGETLQARLDRCGPVEAGEVVRIGRQIAEGLAAAHGTDLVHRDIKPGNILLEGGNQRVKITDFGLARAADDASISQSGIIAGTPMYMAPEQAKGEKIDHRADLFSLGSVMYQMLAGRPPFRASSTLAVLKRVVEDHPRPIREIIPEAPQWLCDIIAKLHAKDPDQRFPSAREVADLLADCEAKLKASSDARGFPKVAPPALVGKAGPAPAGARPRQPRWKWAVAAAMILGAVVACAVTLPPLFRGRAPEQAKGEPDQPAPQPQPQPQPPAPPAPVTPPANYTGVPPKAIRGNDNCTAYHYSPDGKWLFTRDYTNPNVGALRVWDVATGEVRATFPDALPQNRGVAFSPDGKLLAHPERDGGQMHLVVRNVGTFDVVKRWPCDANNVEGIAFDRTGTVVAASADRGVVLWTARTGEEQLRITGDFNQALGLAFSPTADRLLLQDGRGAFQRDGRWDHNSRVHLYDVDPKSPNFKKAVHTWDAPDDGFAFDVHFSPDGARVLFCRGEGEVLRVAIHDAKTGAKVRDIVPQQSRTQISVGAISPDSKRLVLRHGQDGVHVSVWNLDTGERVSGFDLTGQAHRAFAVDPTFRTACIGFHTSSEAKFYDLATGKDLTPGVAATPPPAPVSGAGYPGVPAKAIRGNPACVPHEYSPDGKWLAAQDHMGTHATARIWDARTGESRLARDVRNSRLIAFSPDGRLVAIPEGDDVGHITVFETTNFKQVARWECDAKLERAVFDRTSKVLAARAGTGVALYEAETGKELARIDSTDAPNGIAFSPTADLLAVEHMRPGWNDGTGRWVSDARVVLYDVDPKSPTYKKAVHTWDTPDTGDSHQLRFTPDGARLAFTRGTDDKRIGLFVYDVKTGKQVAKFVPDGKLTQIWPGPFLPDGRTLPVGFGDVTLALWDSAADKITRQWATKDRGFHPTLVVDPTGKTLVTGGTKSAEPLFYDLATGKELLPGTVPQPAPVPGAVAPFNAAKAKMHQDAWAKHLGVKVEFENSIGMKMRLIPPGKFEMGTPAERESFPHEKPLHPVTLTEPFYAATCEVTVKQFREFVTAKEYVTEAEHADTGGSGRHFPPKGEFKHDSKTNWLNPGFKQTDDHPVVHVSWNDAVAFCEWLSAKEGRRYELPTEAQWEFACRAGTTTRFFWGDDAGMAHRFANFRENSLYKLHPEWVEPITTSDDLYPFTAPVGQFEPNAFGLRDMSGNVWEWCSDRFDKDYYSKSPPQNPTGSTTGKTRLLRGGSWVTSPVYGRSAFRDGGIPPYSRYDHIGFRVVVVGDLKTPTVTQALPPTFKHNLGMEFVLVPKGKSWLGGGKDKLGDKEVVIPADFYLGKYEVTQEEWEQVMGQNPSHFSRRGVGKGVVKDTKDADLKRFPVENVSWNDCQDFIKKLNEREKEAGWVYRLPTEVEWEYACRGGAMTDQRGSDFDYYFQKPKNTILPVDASFRFDGSPKQPCKVGTYPANPLGLHDMHGGVWEWCENLLNNNRNDGVRAYRGGSWDSDAEECRSGHRNGATAQDHNDNYGLRVARVRVESAFTDADLKRIAALPPLEQVEEVRKELIKRNPKFDGALAPTIDNNVIVKLEFWTDNVTDVSPVRALTGLKALTARGTEGKGQLTNLAPLQGLPLTMLDVNNNGQLADLAPLKPLPLKQLFAQNTAVRDLAPLAGLKLTELNLSATPVGDLAPLKDMPLVALYLDSTKVTELTPLKGMPLKLLNIRELKLTPARDHAVLRGLAALESINSEPAAEFLKENDKK
jgi:formylglycine-generating enzyme required for sulfatase activity/WD40 repeat protein